jgi:hypothetical protein
MPEYGTRMMRIATSRRVAGALLAVTLVMLASIATTLDTHQGAATRI